MTTPPAHASLLSRARAGYCDITSLGEGANCTVADTKGSWLLEDFSLVACVEACVTCQRCRHISFSRELNDCSWYRRCPRLHAGSLQWYKPSHSTLHVRHVNGTLALPWPLPGAGSADKLTVLAEEGMISTVTASRDAVCLGQDCVGWERAAAAIRIASEGDGDQWAKALPRLDKLPPPVPCGVEPGSAAHGTHASMGSRCHVRAQRLQGHALDMRLAWSSMPTEPELLRRVAYTEKQGSRKGWLPTL